MARHRHWKTEIKINTCKDAEQGVMLDGIKHGVRYLSPPSSRTSESASLRQREAPEYWSVREAHTRSLESIRQDLPRFYSLLGSRVAGVTVELGSEVGGGQVQKWARFNIQLYDEERCFLGPHLQKQPGGAAYMTTVSLSRPPRPEPDVSFPFPVKESYQVMDWLRLLDGDPECRGIEDQDRWSILDFVFEQDPATGLAIGYRDFISQCFARLAIYQFVEPECLEPAGLYFSQVIGRQYCAPNDFNVGTIEDEAIRKGKFMTARRHFRRYRISDEKGELDLPYKRKTAGRESTH